jgi:hypothetical protein
MGIFKLETVCSRTRPLTPVTRVATAWFNRRSGVRAETLTPERSVTTRFPSITPGTPHGSLGKAMRVASPLPDTLDSLLRNMTSLARALVESRLQQVNLGRPGTHLAHGQGCIKVGALPIGRCCRKRPERDLSMPDGREKRNVRRSLPHGCRRDTSSRFYFPLLAQKGRQTHAVRSGFCLHQY